MMEKLCVVCGNGKSVCKNMCSRCYQKQPAHRTVHNAFQKEYNKRPDVKARRRLYNKTYYTRPEVKAAQRAYYQRPEVKERTRANRQVWLEQNKSRLSAYQRAYQKKRSIGNYFTLDDLIGFLRVNGSVSFDKLPSKMNLTLAHRLHLIEVVDGKVKLTASPFLAAFDGFYVEKKKSVGYLSENED